MHAAADERIPDELIKCGAGSVGEEARMNRRDIFPCDGTPCVLTQSRGDASTGDGRQLRYLGFDDASNLIPFLYSGV